VHIPQLALQQISSSGHFFAPHVSPVAGRQNCLVQPFPGGTHVPQLALQQVSPLPQTVDPHFSPPSGTQCASPCLAIHSVFSGQSAAAHGVSERSLNSFDRVWHVARMAMTRTSTAADRLRNDIGCIVWLAYEPRSQRSWNKSWGFLEPHCRTVDGEERGLYI